MRRTGSLIGSIFMGLTGLTALSALGAGTAHASTVTVPDLTGFHQVVASSQYLFYSEGVGSYNLLSSTPTTGLIVTDLAGHYVTTLDSGDGVEGIALSPDGKTLYTALSGKNAVAAITLSTIASGTTAQVLYPLAGTDVPYDVVVQSGKVWVSYNPTPGGAGSSTIGDINLAAATPATAFEPNTAAAALGTWYDSPTLVADPSNSGVIVAAQESISDSPAAAFNTNTDPATITAQGSIMGFSGCGFQTGLTVEAGGKKFIAGCGDGAVFSTSGGTDAFNKPLSAFPISPSGLATDAAGAIALGSGDNTTPSGILDIYLASGARANQLTVGSGIVGLAFSPAGTTLYAVLQGNSGTGTTYSLDVIQQPTMPQPTLTLSLPATSPITQSVTVAGKLTLPGGKVLPTGTPITITRTGTSSATFTAKTTSTGTFAVADHSAGNALGTYTYTASYAGSSTVAPMTTTRTLKVVKYAAGLSLAFNGTTIHYGTTSVVTAHLAHVYTNRAVSVYAQEAGHGKRLIGHGNVNSKGNLTVRWMSPYNVTYSATYTGDARVSAATASHNVRVAAGVSESITGYYGTSGSYRLYTGRETLTANISVAPVKSGQCTQVEIDQYYQGSWQQIGISQCFGLGTGSKLRVTVTLSGLADSSGPRYRIRADYSPTTDKANLGGDSGWQYFIVY
jgi:hypothetical protein